MLRLLRGRSANKVVGRARVNEQSFAVAMFHARSKKKMCVCLLELLPPPEKKQLSTNGRRLRRVINSYSCRRRCRRRRV